MALSPEWQAVGVCEPVEGEGEWFPRWVSERKRIARSLDKLAEVLVQLENEGEFWSPEWEKRDQERRRVVQPEVIDLSD